MSLAQSQLLSPPALLPHCSLSCQEISVLLQMTVYASVMLMTFQALFCYGSKAWVCSSCSQTPVHCGFCKEDLSADSSHVPTPNAFIPFCKL